VKVSEWLRKYQIAGQPPAECDLLETAFWAGWLIGPTHGQIIVPLAERIDMAIRCAEFIEGHSK